MPVTPSSRRLDQVLAVLQRRSVDASFWAALRDAAAAGDDARVSRSVVTGAAELGGRPLAEHVDSLRVALRGVRPDASWVRGLSAPALAAFLFFATGCDPTADVDIDPDKACDASEDYGVTESPGVWCALYDLVEASSVDDSVKGFLYGCFTELSAARREALLEEFQALDDAALAERLNELAGSSECDTYTDVH